MPIGIANAEINGPDDNNADWPTLLPPTPFDRGTSGFEYGEDDRPFVLL
jgi:hypothetical protein